MGTADIPSAREQCSRHQEWSAMHDGGTDHLTAWLKMRPLLRLFSGQVELDVDFAQLLRVNG